MSLSDLVDSTRSWFRARDLRETLEARKLDMLAVARAIKRLARWRPR